MASIIRALLSGVATSVATGISTPRPDVGDDKENEYTVSADERKVPEVRQKGISPFSIKVRSNLLKGDVESNLRPDIQRTDTMGYYFDKLFPRETGERNGL
jgi:hypothetical protein